MKFGVRGRLLAGFGAVAACCVVIAGTALWAMNGLNDFLVRLSLLVRVETGAVSAEYGLILTLVVLVTVLAIGAFGIAVSGLFEEAPPAFP